MSKIKLYFWNIILAGDHFANAVIGFIKYFGSPDECVSTVAYEHYPKLAKTIDFFLGKDHCKHSFERENKEFGIFN